VRALDRQNERFGELISHIHDLPSAPAKATLLYALATCHSLKLIDGEVMGDPLDAKMFEFTGWTLEEGAIGVPARKNNITTSSDRPTALVQTIVRPAGSAEFRVEDALKAGTRVSRCVLGHQSLSDRVLDLSMLISWNLESFELSNLSLPCAV